MNIISEVNKTVLSVLQPLTVKGEAKRMLQYCVELPIDDGVLLFNLLTRECLLLTEEEAANRSANEYLKSHWFVVPEDCNDREYADLVKWVLQTKQPKKKGITGYTIFPTTDCNARCFYCYEMGRSRSFMSEETAHKTVQYIKTHCGGEKVSLSWFGGEPLYNKSVIDVICNGLRDEGVEFTSRVVSNGYLFDEETVKNAVAHWNLKSVQISLDGTEKVYNRAKAYIYREGSPYRVVLRNIGSLLDAGVRVNIRLNTDLYNAEDLIALVDELAQRYGKYENLRVYAHLLFKGNESMAQQHSDAEWAVRGEALRRLNRRIEQYGFAIKRRIEKGLKLHHCMADSGSSVTIVPTGDVGVCEHFSEDEFIGHIERDGIDETVAASWKERTPEIPECAACFYYPSCTNLKKCPNGGQCFPLRRQQHHEMTCSAMLEEYRRWQEEQTVVG